MAFDGSGSYERDNGVAQGEDVWAETQAAGRDMEAALFDAHDNDIATALSTAILKDGTQTITANIPFSSNKITVLGDATAVTDAVTAQQVLKGALIYGGTSTGSDDDYEVALPIAPAAYVAGLFFTFIADRANTTTTVTVNVNGLGAKAVKKYAAASALEAGDILANQVVVCEYDGTNVYIVNPHYPYVKGIRIDAASASQYLKTDSNKKVNSIAATTMFEEIVESGKAAPDTWTPSVSGSGSMTASSVVVNEANYQQIGSFIEFEVSVSFTLGGTASNYVYLTAPASGTSHSTSCAFNAYIVEGGTTVPDKYGAWRYNSSNGIIVFQPLVPSWDLGTNASVHIQGRYQIA